MEDDRLYICVDAAEASDAWGFVGVVHVGGYEAYRTIRGYPVPTEARAAAERLLADVLGALLAGQEWRTASDDAGRAARRADLGLGLGLRQPDGQHGQHGQPLPAD